MKRELICITCPRSCHLTAVGSDGEWSVSGNICPRGENYAIQELTDPRRVVTAVMHCDDPERPLVPVRTNKPYPRNAIPALLNKLYSMTVKTPVFRGEIVYTDVDNPEISVIVCESRTGK